MKKFNLSKIMRRAWYFVKKMHLSISEGLKKSWREAKTMGEITKGSAKQIAWAKDIKEGMIKAINLDKKRFEEKGREKWVKIREKTLTDIEKVDDAEWFINLFLVAKDDYNSRCWVKSYTEEKAIKDYCLRIGASLRDMFDRNVKKNHGRI